MALRQLFPFRQVQYAQVFPLKPVPFCKLFAGLGSTTKFATSLPVWLSPPCLLLRLSCNLNLSGRSGRNCLLSPDYNGSPDTRFSRGTMRLMSWPDGERYSCPLQSLVISLLSSLVFTLLFSRTGGVLSHLNFSTHRFTRFPLKNLSSLVTLAVRSSCFRCNGHSLLLSSYLSRIRRIKNPSCSACGHPSQDISHLILHCPPTDSLRRSLFGDFLSLYDLWSRPSGAAKFLELHCLPPCPHLTEGVNKRELKANNGSAWPHA